jgi:hypothetical protein
MGNAVQIKALFHCVTGLTHVEAAKGGLLLARRGGSVTFAHPFQPIRQVEQFLLDFRDPRLSC